MVDDRIAGETDAMTRFASNVLGSIRQDAYPVAVRRETPRCGGMHECRALLDADARTTEELRRFITHVRQGFTAYASFARNSAETYLNADDAARRLMLDELRRGQTAGLPDISPELLEPPAR